MRKLITLTAMALGLSSGVALADHHRDRGNLGNRSGGVSVTGGWSNQNYNGRHDRGNDRGTWTTNRGYNRGTTYNRGSYNRGYNNSRIVVNRRPVFQTNGRFYFGGNNYRSYTRPVINYHYRNYNQRPALIVENYDAVPGYVWNSGQWEWDGYEWQWIAGHYDVDDGYEHSHVNAAYDSDSDYNYNTDESPGFSAGVSYSSGY